MFACTNFPVVCLNISWWLSCYIMLFPASSLWDSHVPCDSLGSQHFYVFLSSIHLRQLISADGARVVFVKVFEGLGVATGPWKIDIAGVKSCVYIETYSYNNNIRQ